ncbi:hypothetical protein [Streptomyces sp. NBC_01643]|uniref:hypothetical protein n=1 Tax=Streptomyces sp. NBC_01643 TaxID=2975906 RepID=UPI003865F96A|nr:hypothetical protein OHB03_44540 [Streptomyces sp. NBC_01643]
MGIGLAFLTGIEDEHVVRCPVCGRQFAVGHDRRSDAVHDRVACRQAAYRARRAKQVRKAVTAPSRVTTPSTCSASADQPERSGEIGGHQKG